MSDARKDGGGPAFPHPNPDYAQGYGGNRPFGGMSVRDWFAGQALSGLIVNATAASSVSIEALRRELAEESYAVSDAMLEAREK